MRKQRLKNTHSTRNKAQLEANKKHNQNFTNTINRSQIHLLAYGLKFIPIPGTKDNQIRQQHLVTDKESTGTLKPGFHTIAPVATIAAVIEKLVSATVAIYGNTLFGDSSDGSDSGDKRR